MPKPKPATSLVNINGLCVHGELLMYCNICYPLYQDERNQAWIEEQKTIKKTYEYFNKITSPLYTSICGNPYQSE